VVPVVGGRSPATRGRHEPPPRRKSDDGERSESGAMEAEPAARCSCAERAGGWVEQRARGAQARRSQRS